MSLRSQVRLRLLLGDDIAFGPGKADLLQAIQRAGSISAAARSLDMSYRRAWMLVETMNSCFESPLVKSAKGGSGGGGAEVTPEGLALLQAFRRMEQSVAQVVDAHLPLFAQQARKPYRRIKVKT